MNKLPVEIYLKWKIKYIGRKCKNFYNNLNSFLHKKLLINIRDVNFFLIENKIMIISSIYQKIKNNLQNLES